MEPVASIGLSIVIPIYNEVENLPRLIAALRQALDAIDMNSEIVFVDDGSTDGSFDLLAELLASTTWAKLIQLRRNYGRRLLSALGSPTRRALSLSRWTPICRTTRTIFLVYWPG